MLAYVFWHARGSDAASAGYEEALREFQRALIADAPAGLVGCSALAVGEVPWLHGDVYEDWYLVDGWGALGTLNEAAVDARRRAPHDAVAAGAAKGAGAIYALRAGDPSASVAPTAIWLHKPRGAPYPEFRERLAQMGGAVWERELVLGPAPEFCVVGSGEPDAVPVPATVVRRRAVFSGGRAFEAAGGGS